MSFNVNYKPNGNRKIKTYTTEYYLVNSIFGNDWARYFVFLGGRETGKSYGMMKWLLDSKLVKKKKMKIYWLRLTDAQCQLLHKNNGESIFEQHFRTQYHLEHREFKGNTLYAYDIEEEQYEGRDGTIKTRQKRVNYREILTLIDCSTFYKMKGNAIYDEDYDGMYYVVLDEMNRDVNEKNTFDIVYSFANAVENIVRSNQNIKIIMIGNSTSVDETEMLSGVFGFIPTEFGRYKLHKRNGHGKNAVIDYIRPNEAYNKRRANAAANEIAGDYSTFTNEIKLDSQLIVSKNRNSKLTHIIKFSDEKKDWFCLYSNNVITEYHNETYKENKSIVMKRYLQGIYNKEIVDNIVLMFDNRVFRYKGVKALINFRKNLKEVKPK